MAKRARGATRRPGQRRPTPRSGPRPGAAAIPTGPDGTAAPALEPAAIPAEAGRTISPAIRARSRLPSSAFAAESAQEYAYVVSDVRRIVIVAGAILAIMLVLFVVIDVLRIIRF